MYVDSHGNFPGLDQGLSREFPERSTVDIRNVWELNHRRDFLFSFPSVAGKLNLDLHPSCPTNADDKTSPCILDLISGDT